MPGRDVCRVSHLRPVRAAASVILNGQGRKPNCDVIVGRKAGGGTDPILLPFLSSSNEREAEDRLVNLLAQLALPLITKIVDENIRYKERRRMDCGVYRAQDKEDIVNDVILNILDRLRRLEEEPETFAIGNFQGYVVVAARNACKTHLRARYPNRARFKGRLRYALTNQKEFAVWNAADGKSTGGFAEWKGQQPQADSDWIDRLRKQWKAGKDHRSADDLETFLKEMFSCASAPVAFEDILDVSVELLKITDEPPLNCDANPVAVCSDPLAKAAQEERMKLLWSEIQQLQAAHRIALLLSIRDRNRMSVAGVFAERHIASFRDIANAVGMTVGEFICVLDDLPLDDNAIGKRLGVSQPQVITYRLAARRRLERRMGSLQPGVGEKRTKAGDKSEDL